VEPSHSCGIRWMVGEFSKAAFAIGADSLEIEVHCNPEKAMSDASQQLLPCDFEKLMNVLQKYAEVENKTL
jgi:3-deoxy-7-phosphoheptulonate synthase